MGWSWELKWWGRGDFLAYSFIGNVLWLQGSGHLKEKMIYFKDTQGSKLERQVRDWILSVCPTCATSHSIAVSLFSMCPIFRLTYNFVFRLSVFHSLLQWGRLTCLVNTTVSINMHGRGAGSSHGPWMGSSWLGYPCTLVMFSFFVLGVFTSWKFRIQHVLTMCEVSSLYFN